MTECARDYDGSGLTHSFSLPPLSLSLSLSLALSLSLCPFRRGAKSRLRETQRQHRSSRSRLLSERGERDDDDDEGKIRRRVSVFDTPPLSLVFLFTLFSFSPFFFYFGFALRSAYGERYANSPDNFVRNGTRKLHLRIVVVSFPYEVEKHFCCWKIVSS